MGRDLPVGKLKFSVLPVAVGAAFLALFFLDSSARAQWSASTPSPSPTPARSGVSGLPDESTTTRSYPDPLKFPTLSNDNEAPSPSPSPEDGEAQPSAFGQAEEVPLPVPAAVPSPSPLPSAVTAGGNRDQVPSGPWPASFGNMAGNYPQLMNQNLALSGAPQLVGLQGGAGRIRVGPFHIGVGVDGSTAYNSNVFGSATQPKGDIVSTFAPEIFVQAGTRGLFQFYYRPSYERYMKYTDQNTVNQSLAARFEYPFTRLKLEGSLSYTRQSGLFAQSNGPSQQALYLFDLAGTYKISTKTMGILHFATIYQDGEASERQIEDDLTAEFEYNPTTRFRWGGGLKVGYVTSNGESQTFAQPFARASYRPSLHWEFRFEGGVEVREFSQEINPQHQLISPVYAFTIRYSPYRTCSYELSAYQTVFNDSFQSNVVNTQTGLRGTVAFILFNRIKVRGYMDMFHTSSDTAVGESDGNFDFVSGSLTVSYIFHDGVAVNLFDNVQQRFMGTVGDNYFSNVSGLGLSVNF